MGLMDWLKKAGQELEQKSLEAQKNYEEAKRQKEQAEMLLAQKQGTIPTVKDDHKTDKERMEDMGLTMYEWQTAGDEKVRPSHALMDGKLCKWEDPSVYSINDGKTWIPRPADAPHCHPREEEGCRCTALAFEKELLGEL
jgi:hypothetical protein